MSSTPPSDTAIAQRIEELSAQRAPHASICPSEVARSLATGEAAWLALMSEVRRLADELAQAGKIVVTQRGGRWWLRFLSKVPYA